MGGRPKVYSDYNPLILTIDTNFQRDVDHSDEHSWAASRLDEPFLDFPLQKWSGRKGARSQGEGWEREPTSQGIYPNFC